MARWALAREGEESEPSSEEEESEIDSEDDDAEVVEEQEEEQEEPEENPTAAAATTAAADTPGRTVQQRKQFNKIKLGGPSVCHVCGQRGHCAGFYGATYLDCPNKPCYLCHQPGHSTMTCPFRVAPGHGCTVAADAAGGDTTLGALRKREQGGRPPQPLAPASKRWQVDAAVLKLHARRATCVEFHPTHDHLVLSADKHGHIAVWDWKKVYERTVYTTINRWLTNQLRFMPGGDGTTCASSSYDGTVKVFDVETGDYTTLHDANPQGWDQVEVDEAAGNWVTFIGLDVIPSVGAVAAGDNRGRLFVFDPRLSGPVATLQLAKKKDKIQSVHVNPVDNHLLLAAGNDYLAHLLDIRALSSGLSASAKGKEAAVSTAAGGGAASATLAQLKHPKVINAAYFSPITGRKILTTCQDNRLRVWDYLYTANQAPDREIVHSQNFNRYLTPFKAEWDPKDPAERLLVCGRYISEDYGGMALHPIDLLDAATGALVGEMTDPNVATICPVNKPHPRLDLIVSGSSRSLYAWRPAPDDEHGEEGRARQRRGGGGGGGGGGDDGSPPAKPKGSSHYLFFDADPDSEKKKSKPKSKAAAATAASTAAAAEGAAGPSGASAGKGGRGKGKGAAAGAAATDGAERGEAGPSSSSKPNPKPKPKGKRVSGGDDGGCGSSKRQQRSPPEPDAADSDDDFV